MVLNNTQLAPRLVKAAHGHALDRPPVWLMRQAGRYMAEYQAIRSKTSFLELCKNVDLATEVSLQPYNAFGMDAVIMFCDILIPPEAMGMELHFADKGGPVFTNPIRTKADIERLIEPDPLESMGFVMDLLKQLRHELSSHPDTALIGFAGSPWTLATYMIEGGVSKNFHHLKALMWNEPKLLHQLLEKLSRVVTLYLNAQIDAGAQVVQLFDTWGGILPEAGYREFIQPYQQHILDNINRDKAPAILYMNGSGLLLDAMAETRPDVVSLDWMTTITDARKRLGADTILQGNLDPTALLAKPDILKPMVENLLCEGGNQNFIFNVGHGLIPQTPVENVKLLVDTIKQSAPLFQAKREPVAV